MAANLVKDGNRLTVVATGEVTSGSFVAVGALFGIALTCAAKSGDEFELSVGGVWDGLSIATLNDESTGTVVYHKDGALTLVADAADGVAGVLVGPGGLLRLNPSFG